MKNPFKTGRLVTDRLIGKVSAFCLICMAILLPLCYTYVRLRNGYNRQNELAERTRERGYKILQKCKAGWGEVEALKESLKHALTVTSRLESPEQDDLLALWKQCERDVNCKRKDSRSRAQELVLSMKTAWGAYQKAKNQVRVVKSLIEEDVKPQSEKIVAKDIELRERLCHVGESLKSELSRPFPVNAVSVDEYLKSCIGLVEISGQERIRELESRCSSVEMVLMDVEMNRGKAESLSHRLNDACDKIKNALKEMEEQKGSGRKAYHAFGALPMDSGHTMVQFRQKHLTPLADQMDEMDERLKSVMGKWKSGVRQEAWEKIHLASNLINSASAFVEENQMELSRSTVE